MRVILFSGEALDRLDSIDYVGNCDDACSGAILGVINLDMLGYSGEGFGATVMSDEYEDTGEKIDFVQTESIAQLVLDLILRVNDTDP